ncbi:MAG: hypothetical protein HDS82_07380 [Bacteroidales bacterium]|nr:hypothetical protein [Bacteroidales bacterium]
MGAVYVGKRQVKGCLVLIDYIGVCLPPLILDTLFHVMLEHRVPGRRLSAEEVTQREKSPLASALELVEDGVDYLQKIEFLSCDAKMRKYFVIWEIIAKFAFNIKVL